MPAPQPEDIHATVYAWRARLSEWWLHRHNRRTAILIGGVLLPIILLYVVLLSAPGDYPKGEIVTIEDGATLSAVSNQFAEQHVVRSAWLLRAAVFLVGRQGSVIAGDYNLKNTENLFSVARMITTGRFGMEPVRIRIPEGATVREMSIIYASVLSRFDQDAFLAVALQREGYLFPDTYYFLPTATAEVVVRTMLSNFEIKTAPLAEEIEASGHSLHDILTMASLLEKEARIQEDRQKIAGVLWRRIGINMPLQVDAAFLYFLGRTTFDLTLADLQHDSPYNTYKYKGLPPGPIANPGLRSIQAALNPIDTGAIFYLADHSGITHYSKTYEEHLRNKRLYLD